MSAVEHVPEPLDPTFLPYIAGLIGGFLLNFQTQVPTMKIELVHLNDAGFPNEILVKATNAVVKLTIEDVLS